MSSSLVGRGWREAVRTSGHDAFVAHHLAPAAVREVHAGHGWWAVRFAPTSYWTDGGGLLVGGDDAVVATVAGPLAARLGAPEVTVAASVTLPEQVSGTDDVGSGVGGETLWAWMHTTRTLPPVPGEDRVEWDPDPAAVEALLQDANPDAYVRPGDPRALAWAVVPGEDGALLACGAVTEHAPGVPHLSSIAVSTTARRQGLGAAVTAAMARHLLARSPVVSLALWSGNTAARALYDRLGWTGGHDYRDRDLRRVPGPST